MKKRIISLLLALVLLIGVLPLNVLAAQTEPMTAQRESAGDTDPQLTPQEDNVGDTDPQPTPQEDNAGDTAQQPSSLSLDGAQPLTTVDGYTEISTASDFASMDASGKYRLMADITVSAMYTNQFKGTFDGNDKTITLNINAAPGASYYAGLFQKTGSSAVIENVKLAGSITASNGYGVGALVGQIAGITKIGNCESSASVSYTGTNSSAYTGGLIAATSTSGKVTANDCKVTGDVSTNAGKAGGFIGYINAGGCSFTNCSASGTATVKGDATNTNAYGFCYFYSYTPTFSNCTWGADNSKGAYKEVSGLTQTVPEGTTYTVKLTVVPADSTVKFDGKDQTVSGGVCEITGVTPNVQHTYVVTPPEGSDYDSVEESFRNQNVEKTITCPLKTYTLTFADVPEDATLTVKNESGTELTAKSNYEPNVFTVTSGTYTYSVTGSHEYQDIESATVEVSRKDTTETVTPNERAFVTLTFGCDDTSAVYTVSYKKDGWSTVTLNKETDGSYRLHVGCEYTWSYTGEKYIDQSGTIDLTEATTGSTQTVPISKEAKPQKNTDGYYQIGSESALRWMAEQINGGTYSNNLNSENFILTADITLTGSWTPIGKSGSYTAFKGIFDGDGHTISGLNVSGSSTSTDYGLFGYVSEGTIKNLTVKGTITITGNGGSSYGIGGIAGQFNGTKGTIENCVSEVTITGGQNAGGIVGYVSGGYNNSATKAIRNCANLGSITTNSSNAGGIVGYVSGQVTIDSCYNRGNMQSSSYRAGGITAYLNSNYAKIQNCYSTGTVSVEYGSDAKAIVGNKSSGVVTGCYYLSGCAADGNATEKTSDELKALASTLGDAFVAAPASQNDGYPILSFQIMTYPVTFTVTPATATVTIDGQTGTLNDGTWSFKLPAGSYDYTVSAFGYGQQTGSITVSNTSVSENVTLTEAEKHTVTFTVTPTDVKPVITVLWNGEPVTAETDGSYQLADGSYTYTIKAKGYAKISETLTVTGGDVSISRTLIATAAWDGSETEKPTGSGTQTEPYQIDSGAQLAWLAKTVNEGSGTAIYAELTDDIDLGSNPWTPIGNSLTKVFSGSFDGQGHTISGLKVENVDYAGLFGVAKDATLKNIVVQGSVTGKESAGGLVGQLKGSGSIINCGNEATVSCAKYAGGLAGHQYGGSDSYSFTGCYNAGSVSSTATSSSSAYAGGIVGKVVNKASMTNCYNVGPITATNGYAGGLRGSSGSLNGNLTYCYNAGTVTGKEASKQGPFGGGSSDSTTNCYYLSDTTEDDGMTLVDMMTKLVDKLGSTNWKILSGKNQNLPVLAWQKTAVSSSGTYTSAQNVEFETEQVYSVGEDGLELVPLATTKLTWSKTDGATGYFVSIWEQMIDTDETSDTYGAMLTPVLRGAARVGSDTTSYDCKTTVTDHEGVYYAAVSVIDDKGEYALPTADAVADQIVGWQEPYNRMAQITGLAWSTESIGTASWTAREDFTADDTYLVMLYAVQDGDYQYVTSAMVAGDQSSVTFRNAFAAEISYVFSVSALTTADLMLTKGLMDSLCAFSKVYTPGEGSSTEETWVEISTAAQWIELANTEDTFVVPGDSSSGSKQELEWSKNYKLTVDLDFSTLSAEDAAKTKSIGSIDHPFTGKLDGNGHKITGLTLANNDSGLFYYIGATGKVYNLTIEGANVVFADNAAILAENNYGTIENCKLLNCNISADTGAVLGPVASRNYGIIRKTYVQGGTLTSNSTTATGHAGFVGANETGGRIERCWTSMDVSTKSDYAGGFVGLGYGGSITDCFALGDVSARDYSGGFLGRSVFEGNTYTNCYAAGTVTRTGTGTGSDGFHGGNKPDSGFQYGQYSGDNTVTNCYVITTDTQPEDCGATYITPENAKKDDFKDKLGGNWSRDDAINGGLPYLTDIDAPTQTATSSITVQIALAKYDKQSYSFTQMGDTISITMDSTGNTRLVDLMDEAVTQNKLTYSYATTTTYGRYIQSINDYTVDPPDGWMFTINDTLSNVSASLATVKDGDKVLWYEGTTQNRYVGPTWDELASSQLDWVDISTADQLRALASSTDAATLAKNYRLTADIDLGSVLFTGIGSAAAPFTGVFDGQKHKVSGLVMSGTENVGFFNVILGATVKNLTLSNVSVNGQKQVGALVGKADAKLDTKDLSKNVASLIGSCTVTGVVTGSEAVGGLVGLNVGVSDSKTGFSTASTIHSSSFTGTVNGTGSKIGGLVGDNSGSITGSSASGTVSAVNANMVGGLVGNATGEIYDSHADVAVTGKEYVGGLVGSCSGKLERCYSLGAVSGEGCTGSLAGTLSQAQTVVGAGRVTKRSGSSTGYVGGLAGKLNGQIVGHAAYVTIKDAYGNCTQADAAALEAAGNASDFKQSDAQETALETMQLTSWKQVCEKMLALFEVELPCPELELDKYENSVTVYGRTAAGSAITTLKSGQTASAALQVQYTVKSGEAYLELKEGKPVLKAKNESGTAQTAVLTITVTDGTNPASKDITVTIEPAQAQADEDALQTKASTLMHNIAKSAINNDDAWMVFDMTAYATLSDAKTQTQKKQAVIDAMTALAQNPSTNVVSDYSKAEIILCNLGVDTTKLGSSGSFDLPAKLRAQDMSSVSMYTAPYVLLADLQGNVKLTDAQRQTLIQTLKTSMGADGMFGYEYAGVTYPDPDTAAAALAALAPLYTQNADAKQIVDTILASIPGNLNANGSFGNANSDAMMVIGLAALGIDASSVTASSGKSLLEGLLSHANAGNTAFQYPNWTTSVIEDNELATEQGLRALVALMKLREQGGTAYNIYDSANYIPASVQRTIELIEAIGTVGSDSGNAIQSARSAYNALSAEERAEVTNADKLVNAEAAYATVLKSRRSALKQQLVSEYLSYDLTKYSRTSQEKLLDAYRVGQTDIENAQTVEAAEQACSAAIYAMQSIKPGDMTVTFRLIGDFSHSNTAHEESMTWVVTTSYEMAENSTVGDLFVEAMTKSGLVSVGATSGYVSSITAPSCLGSYTLSEFTNGPRSGWMYTVNGQTPSVGMNSFQLKNGDAVVWYYTDDYTASSTYPYAADISPEQYVQTRLGSILTVGKHGTAEPTLKLTDIGRSVTFTFKPDTGYKVKDVKVDGGSVGAVTSYTVSKLTLSTRIEVEFTNGKLPFTDVSENDWFYDDVVFVYEEGLFAGTSDTTFSPNADMTRAMLVTVLYRLEGEPAVSGRSGFADVKLNSYYEDAVTWAANNGIVNGTSDTAFSPDSNVTREQMAAILYRYAQYKNYSTAADASLTGFSDHASVSGYAVTSLQWAVAEKLVNGTAGKLMPIGNATRAQVAAILHRFVENVAKTTK